MRVYDADCVLRWVGPEPSDRNIGDVVVIVVSTDQKHPAEVRCGPEREGITECWRIAELEIGSGGPRLIGIDPSDTALFENINDSISAFRIINRTHDVVELSEVDR